MHIYKYYTAQGCLAQGFTVFIRTLKSVIPFIVHKMLQYFSQQTNSEMMVKPLRPMSAHFSRLLYFLLVCVNTKRCR